MAYFQTNQSSNRAEWMPKVLVRRRWRLIGPSSVIQWLIVGVVGLVLGIYILAVTIFAPQIRYLLILAVLFPFIAMVLGNLRRLLLGLILLDIPLPMDIYLNYRYDVVELNAIGGVGISVTTIALVLLYALWCAESLSKIQRQSRTRVWTSATLALAMYLAFAILSLLVAFDVILSLNEIVLLVQMFLLYVYIVATLRTRQDVLFIVTMLLIGLLVESIIMIGLRLVGHSISVAGILARIDGGVRVGGTIGSPNSAASYLILLLAAVVGVLLTKLGRLYKWLAALAFVLGGIALIFTLSRGGWMAFVLAIAALCFFARRRGWLSLKIPVAVVFGILLLSLLFQDTITARLSSDDASPPETRIYMVRLAFKIIKDNPVLGVGANNFALHIERYATPDFTGAWLHVVHNKYLLVWAEIGIGGLVGFLLFLGITIRRGWQCWKLNDRFLSPIALGLTTGIIAQMIQMLVILFQGRTQLQSLCLAASLITAMNNINSVLADESTDS